MRKSWGGLKGGIDETELAFRKERERKSRMKGCGSHRSPGQEHGCRGNWGKVGDGWGR